MKTRDLLPRVQALLRGAVAATMACCASAWAVPATIQYQGYLSDADGPVTAVRSVVFRLYDDIDPAVAPVALWVEAHDEVAITAGKFTATLGADVPFTGVSFEQALFLELEIGGDKLLPRLPLHSVPYALKAAGVVAGGVTAPMLAAGAVEPGKVHASLAGTGLSLSADGKLQVTVGGITAALLADGSVADRHVSASAAISPAKIAGTAVTLAGEQTLTNKTFDADLNHLLNLDLNEFRPNVVLTDLTASAKAGTVDDSLATAGAIIRFVESSLAAPRSLDELSDVTLSGVSAGNILVADSAGQWWNRPVGGDLAMDQNGSATIQPHAVTNAKLQNAGLTLSAGTGLTGGGSVNLGGSTTLGVTNGGIGATQLQDGAVTNAKLQNAGLTLSAGTGLTGGGSVNLGGSTTLGVANGGIGATQLQDGAVTNAKLQNAGLTLSAGTGLTGGGSVNLGGTATLGVAAGGIGATQIALGTDVSAKGFRAAWAAQAGAVDGPGLVGGAQLNDGASAADDILWSSLGIKEYVDGLVLGLDWQNSVLAFVDVMPGTATGGDRYIATGVDELWHAGSIYEFDGATWVETVPNEGFALWVEDEAENRNYVFNGTWVPLSSTQDHAGLAGLQGGDGTTTPKQYYHLAEPLHDALTGLGALRLLATDEGGLPVVTDLTDWLAGTTGSQVTVTADGNGGAVLSLPQDLAPTSSPQFDGLTLTTLNFGGDAIIGIANDTTMAGDRTVALPTEHAVKAYVDNRVAGKDALAKLTDVSVPGLAPGDLLQFKGPRWENIAKVPGANIELKEDGAITTGSGLKINLAADGTLAIVGNALRVADNGIGATQLHDGAVTNGKLANPSLTVSAGTGLTGGGTVALGGTTTLGVANGGIGAAQLQDGAVTNAKLQNPGLTLSPGTGLTGGGTVALGGTTTLGVANGGIGAAQVAENIDVSTAGFRAAWAADADAVDGAGLDDIAPAASDTLWSSLKTKEYVEDLVNGLDWQQSVKFITTIVPLGPNDPGTRVIAEGVPLWQNHSIYTFDGAAWVKTVDPQKGFAVCVTDQMQNYVFNGSAWVDIGSTADHQALDGLQGGTPGKYYHLGEPLYEALRDLPMKRLLETSSAGLPTAAALDSWVSSAADALSVAPRGDGGLTLSLDATVPQATPTADYILMGTGSVWQSVPQTGITQVGTISAGTWEGSPIAGGRIELLPGGGIVSGSGLRINLDASDGSLVIRDDFLTVGEIGGDRVSDESLTGADILDGSLSGAELAPGSIGIDRLQGIAGGGRPGQVVLANGAGGFQLGSELPMYLDPATGERSVTRVVPTGVGSQPFGVAQDVTGKLYVADAGSHRILVFSRHGEYLGWYGASADGYIGFHPGSEVSTPVAGTEPGAFNVPQAVAVMVPSSTYLPKDCPGEGLLWVADGGNNRIQAIDIGPTGRPAVVYAGDPLDPANNAFDEYGLLNPSGIAVYDEMLYVADNGNHRVFEAIYSGGALSVWGWYGCTEAEAGQGAFHYSEGEYGAPVAGPGDLQFHWPVHLAIERGDKTGMPILAVADSGNSRVMLIGMWSEMMLGWIGADAAGGRGWHDPAEAGPAPQFGDGDGAFREPGGVAFGPYGLAVSDAEADVLEFYTSGTGSIVEGKGLRYDFSSSFGTSGTAPGQFECPYGMTTDLDGSLWVCDVDNSRLQKLQSPHAGAHSVVPWESGSVIIGGDTPEESAALQIDSCAGGLLVPRYDDVNDLYTCIPNPVEGVLVYCYGTPSGVYKPTSLTSSQGFYFWDGFTWQRLGEIAPGAITSDKIASSAVLSWHIASGAVQSWNIQDGTITGDDIQDNSIPASKVQTPNVIHVWKGSSIQTAIDSITDAAAISPYLVRVGPGVFTEQVTMKPYVSIEGAGEGTTVIRYTGAASWLLAVVVRGASEAELRSLTVESNATGYADGMGVYCVSPSFRMRAITVNASGGSNANYGICVDGATASVTGSQVSSTAVGGSVSARGLWLQGGATASLEHACMSASGGSWPVGVLSIEASLTLKDSTVSASGGTTATFGLWANWLATGTSATTLVNSEVTASGAGSTVFAFVPTTVTGAVATAKIYNSRLSGSNQAIVGGTASVSVAGSQLVGAVAAGVKKANCYNGTFDPL